jgi:hypothetical protein
MKMGKSKAQQRWRTGPLEGRAIYAQAGLEPADSDRLIGLMDTAELAAAAVHAHNREVDPAERRWNNAVDWLLNSRHCGDPDIQTCFWAMADGLCTRDEADYGGNLDVLRERIRRHEAAEAR